jgi:enoyl-CoA hydratase
MTEDLVQRETIDGAIAILRFNRPDKLNALSTPLLETFARRLDEIEADGAVRVVIITGAGEKAFVAGADIAEYAGRQDAKFAAYQFGSRALFDRLEALSKPTIAAINGYALGGGFEIALCCDVLIAATNARLGLPEGLLGLSPGGGGTQRLIRSIGRHATADRLLAGARLSGERAHQLGLATAVVPLADLMPTSIEKARAMLKLAPRAQAEMKRLIRIGAYAALPTALSLEQEVLVRLYGSADGQEGIAAFLEKRTPDFKGE